MHMNEAQQIQANLTGQGNHNDSGIQLDWLAFTFKIKDLRHCERAGFIGFTRQTQPHFPQAPVINRQIIRDGQSYEDYKAYTDFVMRQYFEECLRVFVNKVLGLSMSAPLDKQFQFYENSFNLLSPCGESYCGRIGIGGNNDTIHISINGTGCKHVLAVRSLFSLYHWLNNVLHITHVKRADLAFDDFHGLFDCKYALTAAYEGAFKPSVRGKNPKVKEDYEYSWLPDGSRKYVKEQISVGSRSSRIYWRIYNKALEQNLTDTTVIWYRSEVELKEWSIEILRNLAGAFAAINAYAASIESSEPFDTKPKPEKRAALEVLSSTYWLRRQWGRVISDLSRLYNGDANKVIETIARGDPKLGYPCTYNRLVDEILSSY
ncbi:replication initiation factor domain-containing protein [Vibrio sp. SCSIO 43137]|uniref:replication initiation factor domain-containing protein n=1 Tax=Vibrio sp. SCSIO 43137 TaxID=3021011 RepID=UPI0023074943|nr:replication initiation factor domain-containing protein [Vibrio sp. SCSIO 43137]WCE32641.1 replication initiation factor domain-containing protein [Vibrio sp. SCSIO 43137]WCE32648.1 replication initiation factor domain-containing protein [Vibrio sp. SCSIO 43137]